MPPTTRFWSLFAVAAALACVGCKSDCERVCERARDCGYATDVFAGASCSDVCDAQEKVADLFNCQDTLDAYYACEADRLGDGCNYRQGDCSAQSQAYAACGQ
jgi:hypothetical protein